MDRIFLLCIMLALAAGCKSGGAVAKQPAKVTGTVTYLQRSALPPDAVVEVRLEEVSRADAQAVLIAEDRIATHGTQVPISFELAYEPKKLNPAGRYSVRAVIFSGGEMRFSSTGATPVIPNGAPSHIEIIVQPVGGQKSPAPSGVALEGTTWKLIELEGAAISPQADEHRQSQIVLTAENKRLAGMGGVNRVMGSYELTGDSLRFSKIAGTMMAGPQPLMDQEKKFLQALEATPGWLISGNILELRNGSHVLAKFTAAGSAG